MASHRNPARFIPILSHRQQSRRLRLKEFLKQPVTSIVFASSNTLKLLTSSCFYHTDANKKTLRAGAKASQLICQFDKQLERNAAEQVLTPEKLNLVYLQADQPIEQPIEELLMIVRQQPCRSSTA